MKETNYCCKFIHFAHPAMSVNGPTQQLTDLGWFQTCPSKKIRYLEQFLIICRIRASIRRIDAMTKVLIKSEWWNFSVHYINLNDVQFYPLYRMAWNGTRRFNIYTTVFQQIGVFHFMISGAFLIFCCNNLCWKKNFHYSNCYLCQWVELAPVKYYAWVSTKAFNINPFSILTDSSIPFYFMRLDHFLKIGKKFNVLL